MDDSAAAAHYEFEKDSLNELIRVYYEKQTENLMRGYVTAVVNAMIRNDLDNLQGLS